MPARTTNSQRVLVLSAKARDSRLAAQFLARAGIDAHVCDSADALFTSLARWELGAVVLAEEALGKADLATLGALLPAQPPWSDLPVVLFSERSGHSVDSLLTALGGNVTALERPVRSATLITAVRTALRSRRRQYQLRDVLEEMAEATGQLEQQDRRKDEFLAMLGHELRNPLTAILGAVYLLQHARGTDVAARQPPIIERQARHLSRLVNDLLDVSRVTLGKITLERQPVDLREVATRCVQTYQGVASHTLTLALAREPVIVDGDLVRLEQVLSNLVTNALKYTPAGGHIHVTVRREPGEGLLSVVDNGSGIDAELLPNVFDMFTQATPTLDRSRGGLGLGLSLVKSLVERHGGLVYARSEGLGLGSEFEVRLPLAAGNLVARNEPCIVPTTGEGMWVLVVEDNEDARATMQLLLEMWGYTVDTAADGQEGLDKALARHPAVAIVDIGLPKLDGYEVARQIRARSEGPPRLIAVTGYGQPEDRRQALAAGFDHHLPKPVNAEDLALLLRDCAGERDAAVS
ncbi:MAG: response regulator [Nannocystis sp.]|nr:ATP-binding protein [Nannocystis sp.]MBA3548567.1 response regulator [Nannocystis sp.]